MLNTAKKASLIGNSCCLSLSQRLFSCTKLLSAYSHKVKTKPNPIDVTKRYETLSKSSVHQSCRKRSKVDDELINVLHRQSCSNDMKLIILKDDFNPCMLSTISNNERVIHNQIEEIKALEKNDLLRIINDFYRRDDVKALAVDRGIDLDLFKNAYVSFRKFLIQSAVLPVEFQIVLRSIVSGVGNVVDMFPLFLRHAQQIFPQLKCVDELKKISDLRKPADWYPDARAFPRKIIFHAGPTNSGKTYHALQRFLRSNSGVYCGPLKLLASEVFHKANAAGTKCDLVTGEDRRFGNIDAQPSNHVACTVEMTNLNMIYDVAVIDEIQMIRDPQRGWAWTRALLGLQAKEIHLCGEVATKELIEELLSSTNDEFEIREYQRLTKLNYLDTAVETFDNVKPGDCFVCFNKNDIFHVTRELERRGHDVAVIYGSLPPGTKLLQAQRFNDPNHTCKIMVATDAIGMGLNLNIKRIVFYSLSKPQLNEQGEKETNQVTTSQALQIAGRAGRFASAFPDGEVTTFRQDDLLLLKEIIHRQVNVRKRAGLHPTAEQIEMFAYYLPKHSLSNLLDTFIKLSHVDNNLFFLCDIENMKFLADIIEHLPLSIQVRYVFSCAPINKNRSFVCAMYLKYARQFSLNEPVTFDWLSQHVEWPFKTPSTIANLVHLEEVFDCFDLYLWLSSRFSQLFPDRELVQNIQRELDGIIHSGVQNIAKLAQQTDRVEDTKNMLVNKSCLPSIS